VEVVLGFVDGHQDVQSVPGEASPESLMPEPVQDDTTAQAIQGVPCGRGGRGVSWRAEDCIEEARRESFTEEEPDEGMEGASPPVTPEEVLPRGPEEAQQDQLLHVSCRHFLPL